MLTKVLGDFTHLDHLYSDEKTKMTRIEIETTTRDCWGSALRGFTYTVICKSCHFDSMRRIGFGHTSASDIAVSNSFAAKKRFETTKL